MTSVLRTRAVERADSDPALVVGVHGSSVPNPGRSGWAWATHTGFASGHLRGSTNNRAEPTAVLEVQHATAYDPLRRVEIISTSEYAFESLKHLVPVWRTNGWRRADGEPVENLDLHRAIEDARRGRRLRFTWVASEAGHELVMAASYHSRRAARSELAVL